MSTVLEHLGKYELRERLGRGGMAEVWKAFDIQLRRSVAIKVLSAGLLAHPEFMARFEQEARVVASLHHPNIVQVYGFQIARPFPSNSPPAYIVMEYVEGETLAEYLNRTSRQGNFPPASDIVSLFASVAKAVDYAHQRGVIHRDIKPSNILLHKGNTSHSPMGEPILTDFGIAKLLGTPSGILTRQVIGTAHYISPEQAHGNSGSERSDIYSLGVLLYEICTGVRPFGGDNEVAIIMQHVSAMPIAPMHINPHIPPALNEVILRSLAKDPGKRFPSASAMTVAIAEAFDVPMPMGLCRPVSLPGSRTGAAYLEQPDLLHKAWANSTSQEDHPGAIIPDTSRTFSAETVQYRPAKIFRSAHLHLLQGRVPRIVSMSMLILLLAGSVLAFQFQSKNLTVGHFSFLSSGLFNGSNNSGINDMVQIDLHSIPDSDPGKSYYAWLIVTSNQIESGSHLLEKLTFAQNAVHLLYADPQHTNFLAGYSALLITEEDTYPAPIVPSPDRSTWHYLAQIPQTPDPTSTNHYSLLDHLRHLLAADPDLKRAGLPGGLDIWFNRNTEELSNLAGRAGDDWRNMQADDLRRQIIRMLFYLDGNAFVWQDLPINMPLSIDADDRYTASIGLLGRPNEEPPSYLSHISLHLSGVTQAPGATPEMSQQAGQIDRKLNQVGQWLERVHKDAVALIKMDDTQLLSQDSQLILNDLETQVGFAYYGRADQSSGGVQEGVSQIYSDIQHQATFDIIPYTSH